MSPVRFQFSGLEEWKAAIHNLPADLTDEASGIVETTANDAAAAIKAAYPHVTGDVADHVTVTRLDQGRFLAGAIVKNTSPLAFILENGTEARHYVTKNGKQHETGRMPPTHVFIPRIIRARRAMWERLKALLVNHGLLVTGDV